MLAPFKSSFRGQLLRGCCVTNHEALQVIISLSEHKGVVSLTRGTQTMAKICRELGPGSVDVTGTP